jgi:hypothetical protein
VEAEKPGVKAAGERSVAAETISGTVATGDHARFITLEAGTIPAPDQVAIQVPVNNLPRLPAGVFAGRDAALGQLAGALAADASVVVTQAVYGLGGVGKSELALHHAHARRSDYQLRWWDHRRQPRPDRDRAGGPGRPAVPAGRRGGQHRGRRWLGGGLAAGT